MAFELTPERRAILQDLQGRYPNLEALTIPLLHLCQEQEGWCSPEIVAYVARTLNVSTAHVQGVVTFYTMFLKEPPGRHVIWVCRTLSCELTGARGIQQHIEHKLGIHAGQTSADGAFTLLKAECLAACGQGPMVQIDDEFHENLTTEKVDVLLETFRNRPARSKGQFSALYAPPAR